DAPRAFQIGVGVRRGDKTVGNDVGLNEDVAGGNAGEESAGLEKFEDAAHSDLLWFTGHGQSYLPDGENLSELQKMHCETANPWFCRGICPSPRKTSWAPPRRLRD